MTDLMNCENVLQHQKFLPKLIVFDLDYTLWPLWVDTHVQLPFKKSHNGLITDRHGYEVELYESALQILEAVKDKGLAMAVASRTSAVGVAEKLLEVMDLNKYFAAKEIYPGSKVTHFQKFKEGLGIPYCHMLFFDDEERNIRDLSRIGVTAIHVPDGISLKSFEHGLKTFSDKSVETGKCSSLS